VTTTIWLCPQCGSYLRSENLKYGVQTCDSCGGHFAVGDEGQVVHEQYVIVQKEEVEDE
jgi:ribosomal protein L37AE/L43A